MLWDTNPDIVDIASHMCATLISKARIFDGVSVISECGYVMIESGRITQISLREPLSPSSPCTVVDASGCTLLPGLIDAHMHVFQDVELLEIAMRYGVTTVLDLHNEPEWFKALSAIAGERKDVADIKSACYAATIKNGWPSAIVKLVSQEPNIDDRIAKWPNLTDKKSIEEYIARNKAAGASFVKLMQEDGYTMGLPFPEVPVPTPSLELQKSIVDTAHENGMLTIAHALSNHSTLHVLKAGVDGLTHVAIDPITDELIQAYKKNNAFVIPTLAVQTSCRGVEQETREKFASDLEGEERKHLCGCLNITKQEFSIEAAYAQVTALKESGIDVLCGTDTSADLKGTRAGASVHHELWLYVNRCHFTPLEALVSATSKIADRFGFSDRGKIEEGRLADLLLVAGDPVQSIDALRDIKGVWRNGERLAQEKLM